MATITIDDVAITVIAGPVGPRGPAGDRGVRGSTGLDGPQGVQGYRGTQGPRGVAGPQGVDGPQGPAGAGGALYVHDQSVASATWTVNHNFGRVPCVACVTTGGVAFDADIVHVSSNQFVLSLAVPLAGRVTCI